MAKRPRRPVDILVGSRIKQARHAAKVSQTELRSARRLPDLTDQDLEKLGVQLGHRRKLLRAIANLETTTKSAAATSAAVDASPRDAAERRQVTVMFSDLVGSTALSARNLIS
jgi:class 3 adenylate cyclase